MQQGREDAPEEATDQGQEAAEEASDHGEEVGEVMPEVRPGLVCVLSVHPYHLVERYALCFLWRWRIQWREGIQ